MKIRHSGDLGDIICCLAGVRMLCIEKKEPCELILGPSPGTREPMTLERAYNIGSLLSRQQYISRWAFGESIADIDFDDWRAHYRGSEDRHPNLAISQGVFLGIRSDRMQEIIKLPWISAPAVKTDSNIIIYRNGLFPWVEIAEKFNKEGYAVGTGTEKEELLHNYGFAKSIRTPDLAVLAAVIQGAELVVCNQSLVCCLAAALGKRNVWLERWSDCPNVDFGQVSDRDKILSEIEGWDSRKDRY
jgi:hypothetical protein